MPPSRRPAATAAAPDRALALLLGLHGLAFLVVFPLGPQETRLWQPGLPGIGLLAATFPLAAFVGGLLARRAARLPARPATLVALALLGTLPCAFSFDYPSLIVARLWAGLLSGVSYVAIHRVLAAEAAPAVSRLAPRVVAFGMPLCLLGAALTDWRACFIPILAGQLILLVSVCRAPASPPPDAAPLPLHEPAPLALLATVTLATVSAAYLTVLSGFLVYNAGHTEFHIPAGLLLGALLGLAVPHAFAALRRRLPAPAGYAVALAASASSLSALLLLQNPLPALLAVTLIAGFLATNAARHLGLASLISPLLPPAAAATHQTHTHLAHHLGSGLGALLAGLLIVRAPGHGFAHMPALFACSLALSALALGAGLLAARRLAARPSQPTLIPSPAEMEPSEMRSPA